MASLDISTSSLIFKLNSSPKLWKLLTVKYPHHIKHKYKHKPSLSLANANANANAFHTLTISTSGVTTSPTTTKLGQRRDVIETEQDDISLLNERIRRDYSKREASRPTMGSEEADKYIQLVKEQQQRGLQKLKGERKEGGAFSYKVDPYSLSSGDYVVHKKVGIGRFVGIKFDLPKGSPEPIEYVFIEYADGMAKLPVKQASRMLYRYNL